MMAHLGAKHYKDCETALTGQGRLYWKKSSIWRKASLWKSRFGKVVIKSFCIVKVVCVVCIVCIVFMVNIVCIVCIVCIVYIVCIVRNFCTVCIVCIVCIVHCIELPLHTYNIFSKGLKIHSILSTLKTLNHSQYHNCKNKWVVTILQVLRNSEFAPQLSNCVGSTHTFRPIDSIDALNIMKNSINLATEFRNSGTMQKLWILFYSAWWTTVNWEGWMHQ